MRALALVLLAGAGCASFDDPDIVLDFRVLALSADKPEQVVDIDINMPPDATAVLEQLEPAEVCVLLSDRGFDRSLRWSMNLCNLDNDERCDADGPQPLIGQGVWDDPDLAPAPPRLCATIPADGNLLAVALDYLEGDQFRGLGGIYYGVSLRVGGVDDAPELDLYAAKTLRVMPRIPAEVTANTNPFLDHVDVSVEGGEVMPMPLGRCVDQTAPLVLAPDQQIRLTPVEPEGVREEYVAPTIEGEPVYLTESLTYQWLATAGNWSSGRTGGPRDAFGNPATLFTDWTAPAADKIEGPTDVELWFIQRDERLGLAWYQSCVRVVP